MIESIFLSLRASVDSEEISEACAQYLAGRCHVSMGTGPDNLQILMLWRMPVHGMHGCC